MTLDNLFDLVAPIAIYHGADVCFKAKAVQAQRKIRKTPKAEILEQLPSTDRLLEISPQAWAYNSYNKLFFDILREELPDFKSSYDNAGCLQIHDGEGNYLFAGDRYECLPFYESAADLRQRIQEHVSGAVRNL